MPLTTLASGAGAQGWGAALRRRYTAEVLADSPLAFWLLADTSGTTVADSSGNARTLTYYNSPTLSQTGASANIPKSVLFNGTSQYAYNSSVTGLNIAASANWSCEAWFKYTTAGGVILRIQDGSGTGATETLDMSADYGSVAGQVNLSSVNSAASAKIDLLYSGSLNNGTWHHICGTAASGGAMTLYVDGVSRASSSTARYAGTGARGAHIGAWVYPAFPNGNYFYNGNLAAVAFYSTTLSAERVQAHYLAGK